MKRPPASQRSRRLFDMLESRTMMAGNLSPKLLVQLSPELDRTNSTPFAEVARSANEAMSWNRTEIDGLYEVRSVDPAALASKFQGRVGVMFAKMPSTVSILAQPNDPKYVDGTLWGLSGTNGIQAPAAWDIRTSAVSITVADIDTGVDYRHPDLYQNIWINQGEIPANRLANLTDTDSDGLITFWDLNQTVNQGVGKIMDLNGNAYIDGGDLLVAGKADGTGGWADGVSNNGDTYVDDLIGWNFVKNTNNPLDDNNHGTHTVGTIAGVGNNSVGVAGVAWKAQVMALKFLDNTGNGSDDGAARAIRYAADLGARVSNNSWGGDADSPLINNAITYAETKGSLFIAAAGNNGRNTDTNPAYPASAPMSNIVSVASITSSGAKSSFSNYGQTTVDLAAPGSGIYSTTRNGGYGSMSGTSMATPHVAGAAAMVWAQNPTWTYTQVKDRLMSTVTTLASMAGKSVSGGLLNLAEALKVEAPPVVAPTVPNSGFESPYVTTFAFNPSGGSWTFVDLSSSNRSGVAANGSAISSGNPSAPEGRQVAFLQGLSSITQEISGWKSGSYSLTFQAARRGNTGQTQDFRVLVDGVEVGSFAPATTAYALYRTEVFTVGEGTHTVRFEGISPGKNYNTALIDDFKVEVGAPPITPPTQKVPNSGFESPYVTTFAFNPSGGSWTFVDLSSSNRSGVAANGSAISSGNPSAPEGRQVAFLQGLSSITQEISGWKSGSYSLTFQAARRGNTGQTQDFRVLVDGVEVGSFAPATTAYALYRTEVFTVGEGTHTVRFEGISPGKNYNTALIDDFKVEVVTGGFSMESDESAASGESEIGTPVPLAGEMTAPRPVVSTNRSIAVLDALLDTWTLADADLSWRRKTVDGTSNRQPRFLTRA